MAQKVNSFDQPNSLMLATIKLVKEQGIEKTCTSTGIPFHWLRKFTQLTYKNPSVNRVVFLYEHLTNTKLI